MAEKTSFEKMAKVVAPDRQINFYRDLLDLIPTSVVRPFVENAILSIVLIAVLLGLALRRVKAEQIARGENDYRVVERLIGTGYRSIEIALTWVIELVPVAVFGVVARTVGQWGLEPLGGLAVYLGVGLLGLAIQVFLIYQLWLILVARRPLRWFWRGGATRWCTPWARAAAWRRCP